MSSFVNCDFSFIIASSTSFYNLLKPTVADCSNKKSGTLYFLEII